MRRLILSLCFVASCLAQTWTAVSGAANTHLGGVCPSPSPGGVTGCSAETLSWSGGAWDSTRQRLIIWGGGHNDYYGNEVYGFYPFAGQTLPTGNGVACTNTVSSPSMCRLDNPTIPNNNTSYPTGTSSGPTSTEMIGSPSATLGEANAANGRHSYNGMAYDPDDDILLQYGGGLSGTATPLFGVGLWKLSLAGLASNPDGANWTRLDTTGTFSGAFAPWSGAIQSGGCGTPEDVLYLGSHQFWIECAGGFNWVYNVQTNNAVAKFPGSSPNAGISYGSTCVSYPPDGNIYCIGDATGTQQGTQAQTTGTALFYRLNISGSSTTISDITSTVSMSTNCSTWFASALNPGLTYNPDDQKIYGYPTFGNIVYKYDPLDVTGHAGGSCTDITPTGPDGAKTSCPAGSTSASDCPPDQLSSGSQYTTGIYGRFQYMGSGRFVLVNSVANNGYTFALPVCSFNTSSLPNVNTGQQYNQPVNTSNCTAPLTFSITSGSLPSGMVINASTGAITGFAWTSGASSFTVHVVDNAGASASQPLSITVVNPTLPTTSNTITVTNATGSPITNFPIQIGRAFADGELTSGQSPQSWVGANAVPTQWDIKNSWADGDLKYGILSFVIPSIAASSSVTVSFAPGSVVGNLPLGYANNSAAVTAILASSAYNFDAQIQLAGSSHSPVASARTMLSNGDYTAWTSGPIATMYVIANHAMGFACVGGVASGAGTVASKYDVGTADGNCPFRPEFEATFWVMNGSEETGGGTHVNVRYIGEVANTQNLEDVIVSDVVLTLGNTSPTTVYDYASSSGNSSLTMGALTRWTYSGTFGSYGVGNWIGGTPSNQVGINHNLAYLASTKLLPNYDTSVTIPGSQITTAYSKWTSSLTCDAAKCISPGTKDLYNQADFTLQMGDTGSRAYPASEIGPYTGPEVMWLYTGDYRAQQMAIRYAELAAAWPVHWREGKGGKTICRTGTSCAATSGVGHWMSVSSRPTYCWGCGSTFFNGGGISGPDLVTPVGSTSLCPGAAGGQCGWQSDIGHVPDWSPVYLLTGDYFFLEEMWAFTANDALQYPGIQNGGDYTSRGPTGAEGHIPGSAVYFNGPRATGWGLRSRVEVAALSPDGTPEQLYYDLLTRDLLAALEGERNVTLDVANQSGCTEGGINCAQYLWNWGNQFASASFCSSNPSKNGLWCNNGFNHSLGVPTIIPWWVPDAYNNGNCNYPISTAAQANSGCTEPWMVDYVIYALGRAVDLGYGPNGLLAWVAPMRINNVVEPAGAPNPGQIWTLADGYNPFLVSATGQVDIQPSGGGWTTTYPQILASTCSSVGTGCNSGPGGTDAQTALTFQQPVNQFNCGLNPEGTGNCGGALEAAMGLSQLTGQPGGQTAWSWIYANAMSPALNNNASDPKWDILPRSLNVTAAPSSWIGGAAVSVPAVIH